MTINSGHYEIAIAASLPRQPVRRAQSAAGVEFGEAAFT
jgi:hypothetical protein